MPEPVQPPTRLSAGSWDKATLDQLRKCVSHRTLLLAAYTSLQMAINDAMTGVIRPGELYRRSSVLRSLMPIEMRRIERLTAVRAPQPPRTGVREG